MISTFKLRFAKFIVRFPFMGAILAQCISVLFLRNFLIFSKTQIPILSFVFLQSFFSVLISHFVFKLPRWFFIISFIFPFLFLIDSRVFHLSSSIYGFLFIFFALTFSHTLKERVPLYLTNNTTFMALRKIIRENRAKSFVDLGSGLGGVVRAISLENIHSEGVETAPLLWLISTVLCFGKGSIKRKNIWDVDLSKYDVIYAFLSPAVMDKLYEKVQKEMRTDAVFISNSFQVVGEKPIQVLQLEDARKTQLYFYKKII